MSLRGGIKKGVMKYCMYGEVAARGEIKKEKKKREKLKGKKGN